MTDKIRFAHAEKISYCIVEADRYLALATKRKDSEQKTAYILIAKSFIETAEYICGAMELEGAIIPDGLDQKLRANSIKVKYILEKGIKDEQ